MKLPLDFETLTTRIEALKAEKGDPPWAERVVSTGEFFVTAICQAPGHENDYHYHEHDEAWVILEGELAWHYEHAPEPHVVRAGDFVFAPKNLWHHIEVLGDKPAIRIGITPAGEYHKYDRPGAHPAPPKQTR